MSDFSHKERKERKGWEVRRSKYIWHEVINLSKDGSEQLLSVSQYDGVRPASEASRSESLKGYKIVEKGDLVINIMLAWMGGLGVSEYDGIVSPAYAVYKPIAPMEPRFLHYLYRTRRYLADFARHSTGVVPSRWRMYSDDFGQVVTELPPLPEQKAIVAYLDAETGRIDKAIAAEEKMIALLQERREIVINEAVASRNGWEMRRLRYLADFSTGNKDTVDRVEEGMYPFFVRSPKVERINSYTFDGEAILMAGDGVGAGKVFHHYIGKFDYHQRVYNIHNFRHVFARFLFYYIQQNFKHVIELAEAKSTVDSVRIQMLKNFPIPLPPLSEQEAIVERLDRETGKIDRAIEVKRRQIELLRERRQIVIDEVVTGKVKVA